MEGASPAFGPLALWSAGSFASLVLATMGPRLWATQPAANATIAIEIVAIGQALLAAIIWPIWTRSVATTLGILFITPAWLLLAARIAAVPATATLEAGWKLEAGLLALAVVRALTPRAALGVVWASLLALSLGGPVLWFLRQGG